MALTSFTLRKTSTGSNLRRQSGLDNSIRADGVSSGDVIASLTTGISTFSANVISKGTVRLSWTLSSPLEYGTPPDVVPRELHIVSSYSGEPVTIKDGIFVEKITPDSLFSFVDNVPKVSEGRWVYYSLFIKYVDTTTNDFWFVRAATLYIQIPISYNSIDSMWTKIPEYYRTLDEAQEVLSSGNGPLYSFLELFGNELDRNRTLIETVALSNDPELAVTPALQQLAYETGLEIGIDDLGTSKVRSLINNIGNLRQRKGTIGSINSYISAMSGCRVEYEYNDVLPRPHVFNVYAQRANFISDPEFSNTTITTSGADVGNILGMFHVTWSRTSTWGVFSYTSDLLSPSHPVVTCANNILTIQMPSNATSSETVLVYPRKPFPYLGTQLYGTSYDYSSTAGASFTGLHTSTNTQRLAWETGVGSASMPDVLYADTSWYGGLQPAYSSTSTRPSYEYVPSTTGASVTVSSVPVLEFTMVPGSTVHVSKWLFEPAVNGEYFSGNTRDGGYIPIQTGVTGQGTFDYYWDSAQGGANDSFSYYLMDHEKTIKTTERVIRQSIVPVTMMDNYTINWDYYPGKT